MSMNSPTLANKVLIDTPLAAMFFVDLTRAKHLRPFMVQETSLSEAAHFLNISKTRMSYWVKKLQGLNLIEKVRVEKRGKHNVPIYRSMYLSCLSSLFL
jgi:predicted transcriptional regulator